MVLVLVSWSWWEVALNHTGGKSRGESKQVKSEWSLYVLGEYAVRPCLGNVLSCLINLITWIYNFNQEIKSDQHWASWDEGQQSLHYRSWSPCDRVPFRDRGCLVVSCQLTLYTPVMSIMFPFRSPNGNISEVSDSTDAESARNSHRSSNHCSGLKRQHASMQTCWTNWLWRPRRHPPSRTWLWKLRQRVPSRLWKLRQHLPSKRWVRKLRPPFTRAKLTRPTPSPAHKAPARKGWDPQRVVCGGRLGDFVFILGVRPAASAAPPAVAVTNSKKRDKKRDKPAFRAFMVGRAARRGLNRLFFDTNPVFFLA